MVSDGTTLFATQQYALWHYLKNNNAAYNNAMQNSDGTYNAIPNAKTDRKYYTALYISLVGLADQAQSNGYNSPNINTNAKISLINDGNVKTSLQNGGKTALIGPYKLENNNSNFSKSFSATVNSENADKEYDVDFDYLDGNTNKVSENMMLKETFGYKINN